MTKSQHPIDAHVGKRLLLRRRLLGWSQGRLGEAIGLTFQQIQKYEKGANRISCSRLFEFAQLMEVPPTYFFDDLPANLELPHGKDACSVGDALHSALMGTADHPRRDTLMLVRAFERVSNKHQRCSIVNLLKSLADTFAERHNLKGCDAGVVARTDS